MTGRALAITLAVTLFVQVGCGDPQPEAAQGTDETGSSETGSRKLEHDSEPTFTPYRPDNMTGLTSLGVEVIKQGNGPVIEEGAILEMHYKGTLMDGTVFGQSDRSKPPVRVVLKHPNGVIKGWVQGLVRQREGVILKLSIPASLGYGREGRAGVIPPDADLLFEVEVVRVHQ